MARLWCFLLVVLVLGLSAAAPVAADQPVSTPAGLQQDALPDDFDIPSGHFFTQALPGQPDGPTKIGFSVQDGVGANLWTAYQAAGGVFSLGYPISRRFEWDKRIAQAFSGGVLVWNPATGSADVRQAKALPGGHLPAYAVAPEQPPEAAGELVTRPWSGWWWPASQAYGGALFAPDGPLAKYDAYVQASGQDNPGTQAWELANVNVPGVAWAGHCNGWAAAALLEPEPTQPVQALGITFSVADQKGLLSDEHFADAAAWSYGGDSMDLSPADFQRMLLTWFFGAGKGFIITYQLGGGEVWSFPIYRVETSWGPDAAQPDLWHVQTHVWMATDNVDPDAVGTQPYPGPDGALFTYDLTGDPRNPTDGAWTGDSAAGRFSHPGRIWYPTPSARNLDRTLTSPNLDPGTIANILNGT